MSGLASHSLPGAATPRLARAGWQCPPAPFSDSNRAGWGLLATPVPTGGAGWSAMGAASSLLKTCPGGPRSGAVPRGLLQRCGVMARGVVAAAGLTDADVLQMLDLYEGEGLTMAQIAARMGRGLGSVVGAIARVRRDLAASEAVPGPRAVRAKNRDGALGRGWWKRGLRARQARGGK